MKLPSLFLALSALALSSPAFSATESMLIHARRAQALLGPDVWSEVVHIENTGSRGHYPRTVDALVFELAGILWFYADTDGTQSFSLHRGRLAEEKADLGPLLRGIHPGFTRWTVLPDDGAAGAGGVLPNGCFVESVAALRRRLALGAETAEPQLLSFYAEKGGGHTVLMFSTARGVGVVDPLEPNETRYYPTRLARDPQALAREVSLNRSIATARVLPLADFSPRSSGTVADARRVWSAAN